jgi:hypothetical protein
MFSLDIVGTQPRQYFDVGLIPNPQILHNEGGSEIGLVCASVKMPLASRFRLCVNRVAGPSVRARFDVIDQSDRAIPSAKGATARAQMSDVSDSLLASELIKRQFPSRCSKNHSRCKGARLNQSNR